MSETEQDLVATLLVSEEPQRQAARVLELMIRRLKARGGAVVNAKTKPASIFVSWNLDLAAVGELSAAWVRLEGTLAKGESTTIGDGRALPLPGREGLAGALYVVGAPQLDTAVIKPYLNTLFRAMESYDRLTSEPVPVGRGHRLELLKLLQEQEWNISRVSRLLGVTRRTIYLRMLKYGIEIDRKPKTHRVKRVAPA